jgi:hypothetical protein
MEMYAFLEEFEKIPLGDFFTSVGEPTKKKVKNKGEPRITRMSGYKYFVKHRMSKFIGSMKDPIEGMWLWGDLGLSEYTRDLWEKMTEERKEEYNRLYVEKEIFEKVEEQEMAEELEPTYSDVATQTD